MILKANQDVRDAAKAAGVKQWEIAAHLGISEPTIVRWMRVPMTNDRKKTVMQAISELASGKREGE